MNIRIILTDGLNYAEPKKKIQSLLSFILEMKRGGIFKATKGG